MACLEDITKLSGIPPNRHFTSIKHKPSNQFPSINLLIFSLAGFVMQRPSSFAKPSINDLAEDTFEVKQGVESRSRDNTSQPYDEWHIEWHTEDLQV